MHTTIYAQKLSLHIYLYLASTLLRNIYLKLVKQIFIKIYNLFLVQFLKHEKIVLYYDNFKY